MNMLEPILETTRTRIAALPPLAELKARAGDQPPVRDFAAALTVGGLQVIAEIKRRSPSAGEMAPDLDPVGRAVAYEQGGAAAISVLTEPDHFSGSLDDLVAVRAAVAVPVLRKDFILNTAQMWEARAHGADAVLLIVAALAPSHLAELLSVAAETGLAALVEVHSPDEVGVAIGAGASIIGVNNRDLTTFHTDLGIAEAVAPMLIDTPVRIAESAVSDVAGAGRMAAAGYDAVLVGETLVTSGDPTAATAGLVAAGTGRSAPQGDG